MLMCADACVCVCVCVCACVRACVRACARVRVCACVHALRMVSTDKSLRFINALIVISGDLNEISKARSVSIVMHLSATSWLIPWVLMGVEGQSTPHAQKQKEDQE